MILCTVGVLAIALAAGSQLTGQVSESPVIYKSCDHREGFKEVRVFGQHESCGIDETATRIARETWERTEELKRQQEEREALTAAEEERITEHLEKKFLDRKQPERQAELQSLLATAANRLETILGSSTYTFTDGQVRQFENAQSLVASLTAEYDRPTVTKHDIRRVRDQLAPLLTEIQGLLTEQQRDVSEQDGTIQNLVTRIDNLVARVGTVIRDLELAGEPIPVAVQQGHRKASQLVRETKRSCSIRRPASCSKLREVLDEIDAIREPLCEIDSPLLSFC